MRHRNCHCAQVIITAGLCDRIAGFHTGFFAGGGKLCWISEYPCRGAWGYSIRGSLSLDVSC